MRYIFIVFVLFFLSGCLSYSKNPLTKLDDQKIDTKLYGTWYYKDGGGEIGYVHIGLDRKSKQLKIVMTSLNEKGAISSNEFIGHTSVFEDSSYLNLKWVNPQPNQNGYMVQKYVLNDNMLDILFLNSKMIIKAIEDEQIHGTVDKSQRRPIITIQEDSEILKDYVIKRDKDLFLMPMHLLKLTITK
ncbi:MAG: hypothetical protein U9N30_08020 [Campylobacterota bacterium]|nr:hypothetical protein [Campylobacterota bacterium]